MSPRAAATCQQKRVLKFLWLSVWFLSMVASDELHQGLERTGSLCPRKRRVMQLVALMINLESVSQFADVAGAQQKGHFQNHGATPQTNPSLSSTQSHDHLARYLYFLF